MKKLLIAGAAGAMIFGLTAASASTLNLESGGGWFSHTVQQSDIATVTCATGKVEVGMQINGTKVTGVRLQQQTLQACGGSEVQVVAFKGDSKTPYAASSKTRILANGLDTFLTFTPALNAQDVANVRVTIADDIVSSGAPAAPAK